MNKTIGLVQYGESRFSNSSLQTKHFNIKTPEKHELILLRLSSCNAKRYNYSGGKRSIIGDF